MPGKAIAPSRFCRQIIGLGSDHAILNHFSMRLPFCLLLFVSLCPAGQQSQTPAQTPAQTSSAPSSPVPPDLQAAIDQPAAPVDPHTYKIGAEDIIRIHVWKEPDLTLSAVVRPDGRISLPLIGEIESVGMTPMQLQAKLIEAYDKFLNRPQILVSVVAVRSKKYYMSGNIGRTGPTALVTPTTMLQAISAAGGFREFAKKNKIIIMRGNERIKFNYKDVISGKHPEQNIFLQDGDHIYVP